MNYITCHNNAATYPPPPPPLIKRRGWVEAVCSILRPCHSRHSRRRSLCLPSTLQPFLTERMGLSGSEPPRGGKGNPYPRRVEIKNKIFTEFAESVRSLVCSPGQDGGKSPGDGPRPISASEWSSRRGNSPRWWLLGLAVMESAAEKHRPVNSVRFLLVLPRPDVSPSACTCDQEVDPSPVLFILFCRSFFSLKDIKQIKIIWLFFLHN